MPTSLVQPTRILVVGGGGREHALAWKLAAEPGVNEVFVAPGSDAIGTEPRVRCLPGVDPLDGPAVVAAARSHAIELVVVGPEAPLSTGVGDACVGAGFACCGPTADAARIETSKAFCHEVARAAGVRTARSATFSGADGAAAASFARELAAAGHGIVLKADGLAAGKGVIVTDSLDQALEFVPRFVVGRSQDAPALVIEERVIGREASVIAICDGERVVALPAARDHKRLCDGDRGPNTGGMGAYSPLPDLPPEEIADIVRTIHVPILTELARRGHPFRGFLYAGLMLTDTGPVLLECNARLGDPETQVMLPRLAVALGPWLLAAARGSIPTDAPPQLPELPGATVGVVLAAKGYPNTPRVGEPIDGLEAAATIGGLVFHAATLARRRPEGGFGTNGGRVLTVVGRGPDLAAARLLAETAADAISWPGMQRRRDIAAEPPSTRVVAGGPVGAPA